MRVEYFYKKINSLIRFVSKQYRVVNFILLLIVGLLYNCSNNILNDSNIIDEDTFVDVLVDIHITDAALVVKGLRINTDSTQIRYYYNDVLLKHDITQKQLQQTLEYYTKKPRDFEKLYKRVSEKVVKLEEDFADSIDKEE